MASYKDRLTGDLDRWIAAGLVEPARREAILTSVPDARRMDAATALAWVGSVLLGVAIIAFTASNWDVMPRVVRFIMIVAVYGAAAGIAAWMAKAGRPNFANGLLTFTALVFAAAIGLTGQIFDITGDPRRALYIAGACAAVLALAGRASSPAMAALLFVCLADFMRGGLLSDVFDGRPYQLDIPWLLLAAPAAAVASVRWRSTPLAHAAGLGVLAGLLWAMSRTEHFGGVALGLSIGLLLAAGAGRRFRDNEWLHGRVFLGWALWGALGFFIAAAELMDDVWQIPHRLLWLALGGGLIALGRHDRIPAVTAAGAVGLLAAIATVLMDLGLDLMAAAGIFAAAAVFALIAGVLIRRHRS